MVTGVGSTYCLNLTEEEKLKIDEEVRKNRVEAQMLFHFALAFLGVGSYHLVSESDPVIKPDGPVVIRPKDEPRQEPDTGKIYKTGSGDLIDSNGKRISKPEMMVRGGDGSPSSPSKPLGSGQPSPSKSSSFKRGVADGFTPIQPSQHARRNKSLFDGAKPNVPKNNGKGTSKSEAKPNSGKGSSTQKTPRLPSGVCKDYKNQGLGSLPNPSGSGSNAGNGDYGKGRKNKQSQSTAREFLNPSYISKKGKQSKNPKRIRKTSGKVLKRQAIYDRFQEFKKELLADGVDTTDWDFAEYQRFEDMCKDPKTGFFLEKNMFQAEGGLALEAEGVFKNVRANTDPSIDIDLVGELASTGETVYIDSKRAIDYGEMRDNFGNLLSDTAHQKDPKIRAFESGKKAVEQQRTWAKAANGKDIYEFYDMKDFRTKPIAPEIMGAFMDGVEQMGGDPATVLFARYK